MVAVMAKKEIMASRKPRVVFVVDEDVKKDLETLAEMDQRTLSNFMVKLAVAEISRAKKDGRLPSD